MAITKKNRRRKKPLGYLVTIESTPGSTPVWCLLIPRHRLDHVWCLRFPRHKLWPHHLVDLFMWPVAVRAPNWLSVALSSPSSTPASTVNPKPSTILLRPPFPTCSYNCSINSCNNVFFAAWSAPVIVRIKCSGRYTCDSPNGINFSLEI